MVEKFDSAYFESVRMNQQVYINKIAKIKYEPYDTDNDAAIAALSKVWYRSLFEGEEYGGAIYYRNIGGRRKYGFGPAKKGFTIPFIAKFSVIDWTLPPGVTRARIGGAYHTHVPTILGNSEAHSEHDKKMAKNIGGPVYVSTPNGLVKVALPMQKPRAIGRVSEPDVAEHLTGPPPMGKLRELHQQNMKWFIDQLPEN